MGNCCQKVCQRICRLITEMGQKGRAVYTARPFLYEKNIDKNIILRYDEHTIKKKLRSAAFDRAVLLSSLSGAFSLFGEEAPFLYIQMVTRQEKEEPKNE